MVADYIRKSADTFLESVQATNEKAGSVGAASELQMPHGRCASITQGAAVQFDDRLSTLLLDALAPVEAAIGSSITGLPYSAIRVATDIDEYSRQKLLRAAQATVAAHPTFFAKHRGTVEIVLPLVAISAAQVDQLLMMVDAEQARSGLPMQPFSASQALMIALFVLMPVLLPLAGFVLYNAVKKG